MYDNMQEKHERIFEIGEAGTMERLENKACVHDAEVEMYKTKIVEITNSVHDVWILRQVYNFIINMTKEGD